MQLSALVGNSSISGVCGVCRVCRASWVVGFVGLVELEGIVRTAYYSRSTTISRDSSLVRLAVAGWLYLVPSGCS